MIQTSSSPYFDDYDQHKHFYSILYRPGYSIQARELTQMQTIIQEQVRRMGNHTFKEGTVVIPGELSFDNEFHYVKLLPTYGSLAVAAYLSDLVGLVVQGGTSGITAQVLAVATATTTEPDTIYVKYLDGGTSGSVKIFADNETIAPVDTGITGKNVQTAAASSTGLGSAAIIKEGVYYINGYFVLCESQTLILDKYTNSPTYHVGFKITESIVTPEQDETLLDNAQGSYNFAAPGAHRLTITLTLEKRTLLNDVTDGTTFLQLVNVIDGAPQNVFNQTQYAELAKVMARRTFDESGDYVTKDFKYSIREHRSNDRGAWAAATSYLADDIVTHGGSSYFAIDAGVSVSDVGTWPTEEMGSFNDGGVSWRWREFPNYNYGLLTPEQGGLEDHMAVAIEPGKAYVRGYEIEKVAATYISVPKPRTTLSEPAGSINTDVGNYVLVTNVHGIPDLSVIPTATIYTGSTLIGGVPTVVGTSVGTARVRYFELHSGTIGTLTAIYKLGLFDITTTSGIDFARDAKSFYINGGTAATSFTADVSPVLTKGDGTVTMANTSFLALGTGVTTNSTNVITSSAAFTGVTVGMSVTGTDIPANTTVTKVTSTSNLTISAAATGSTAGTAAATFYTGTVTGTGTLFNNLKVNDVLSIDSKLYRLSVLTSNSVITVLASPNATAAVTTGVAYYLVKTAIVEPQKSSMLFFIENYVKSLRDPGAVNQIHYTTNKMYSGTTDGAGTISFTIAGSPNMNTFASPAIQGNYIATLGDGVLINLTSTEVTLSGADKTCTVAFGGGYLTTAIKLIATLNKTGGVDTEKTKVLTLTTEAVTTVERGTARVINLPKCDCVFIFSVKMKSGTYASPTGAYDINISSRYMLDPNQTDSYYGPSKLVLRDGFAAPLAPFQVAYAYYAHSTTGDYFTMNSYGLEKYAQMPSYNGQVLSDYLDFRPRMSDDGTSFDVAVTGANPSYVPKRGYDITCQYDYYIGRTDKLCIEPTGEFHLISGVPSINPVAPPTSATGMLLNTMIMNPYCITPADDVKIETVDNRRYTMQDIGKLDKRITNLEYYTTLTSLEQDTTSMAITDTSGLNRYKNGFIVDAFMGHGIGDSAAPDYNCSIDTANGLLRPFCVMKNVQLYETDTNNRAGNHYKMTGDLITLPYTDAAFITQSFASRSESVNPFAVFTFVGVLDVTPATDDWIETARTPDLTINTEGNYNTLLGDVARTGALGTVWNAWQTVWTGTNVTGTSASSTIESQNSKLRQRPVPPRLTNGMA